MILGSIEQGAFQNGQHIEKRHRIQYAAVRQGHIVAGDVHPGENTTESSILMGNGQGGNGHMGLEHIPGSAHGDSSGQHRGFIKVQIPDLGMQIGQQLGGGKTKAIQHCLSSLRHRA